MWGENPARFAAAWMATALSPEVDARMQRNHAFVRLWRAFMHARVSIAVVLLALQGFVWLSGSSEPHGLLWVCSLYLLATLAVLWVLRPVQSAKAVSLQWLWTIGVDVLLFAALQYTQKGGFNYTPLFALPVLLASILGPLLLGLATAASVTLLLLGEAWFSAHLLSDVSTTRLLQAALTSIGFFLVALLANQLARRLAREEAMAESSQATARTLAQINELVIDSLNLGVLVVDAEGNTRNANPAAQTLLMGMAATQVRDIHLPERASWAGLWSLVQETFAVGQPLESEITVTLDQYTSNRLAARTQLTTPDGEGLCVLFLEDLREVEARVRTEKLASMGRMSAAVAHEIRNPLSAIAQANALLDEEVQSDTAKRLTRMIEQNAQRLARIVDDILKFARAAPGPTEVALTLPLEATLRQIVLEWSQQHQAQDRLGLHLHTPTVHIGFDPDHLRRLLVNLLDNALRHASGQATCIRIITQAINLDRVRLSVWSDGPPLEQGVLRHLFEPFFSSESRSSGLGLYICRELCERYGAQIAYQRTRLDQRDGNAFYVTLRAAGIAAAQTSRLYVPGDSEPGLVPPDTQAPGDTRPPA
jgi:two-component system sensor histidine kinase PilS (NtrC family)